MNTDLDHLKALWGESRQEQVPPSPNTDEIIRLSQKKMRSTVQSQWATVIILTLTLLVISTFFKYVAGFNHTLSLVGVGFMTGGLIVRILLELISIYLSKQINLAESALQSNQALFSYSRFRNVMNGPVTITILVLYSIGFYMLSPEFSLYFSPKMMILINLSYIPAAGIFTWSIVKAVKKERMLMNDILRIQNDLMEHAQA